MNDAENVKSASSLEEALKLCEGEKEPFIIGGGKIYAQSMPLLSKIIVTRIDSEFPDADTYFPEIKDSEWILAEKSPAYTSKTGLNYCFETYERRNNQ